MSAGPDNLTPPKRTKTEDPGARELESDSEDHFSDAQSIMSPTPTPASPIPRTRVEKVSDEPSYGEVPGTEAYRLRVGDAAPDEIAIIPDGGADGYAQADKGSLRVDTAVVAQALSYGHADAARARSGSGSGSAGGSGRESPLPGGQPIPVTVVEESAGPVSPHSKEFERRRQADAPPDLVLRPDDDGATVAAAAAGAAAAGGFSDCADAEEQENDETKARAPRPVSSSTPPPPPPGSLPPAGSGSPSSSGALPSAMPDEPRGDGSSASKSDRDPDGHPADEANDAGGGPAGLEHDRDHAAENGDGGKDDDDDDDAPGTTDNPFPPSPPPPPPPHLEPDDGECADDFGDDFDDFEDGADHGPEFDEFDDGGFHQPSPIRVPSPRPVAAAQPPPAVQQLPLGVPDLDGLEPDDLSSVLDPYLALLFPPERLAAAAELPPMSSIRPESAAASAVFPTPRSASLWSQLVAPPPLAPPDWIRSRIRRAFLVSLGVPVDLDEILPASKQKKLVLPSLNSSPSRRNSSSRLRPGGGGGDDDAALRASSSPSLSVDSHGNSRGRGGGGGNKRPRGPPPAPDLDLVSARQLCMTTPEALAGMTDDELREHAAVLEAMESRSREVLEYWQKRADEKIGDRDAFEGVIENLVKHARKVRK